MNILSILKEEQSSYRKMLLEAEYQDTTGAAMVPTPGSTPASKSLYPTSFPRNGGVKFKLKFLKQRSMEETLQILQQIQQQEMQQQQLAQQQQQAQGQQQPQMESVVKRTINNLKHFVLGSALALPVVGGYNALTNKEQPIASATGPQSTQPQQVQMQSAEAPKEENKKLDIVGDKLVPYLKQQEGWRSKVYKDSKGNPTVGHGALVDSTLSKTLQTVFPDQPESWRNNITSGRGELSKDQGHQLLSHQATDKYNEARDHIGQERFDTLTPDLQSALASEHFRGMLKKSPKVVEMIKSGNFKGASKEYLNAEDYNNNPNNSIGKRMKDLSDALAKE